MIAIYACTLLVLASSLAIGRAILIALGGPRPAWMSGVTGFATLVIVAPFVLRLPGRATTALVIVALATLLCAWVGIRDLRSNPGFGPWREGVLTGVVVVAVATIPFLVAGRTGVLGEGIYTNDHAAQLYWADWLQRGFGPEPSAVQFGYPTGPQSVAVLAAQASGASLVSSFNGLLLAIPALTGLTALGGLRLLAAPGRVLTAIIVALPYLGASFLAQSAFKETAMALFVLAFALLMATRSGEAEDAPPPSWRLLCGVGALLALASVFTFSVPGLAWFAIAAVLWLATEELFGQSPVDWTALRRGAAEHRVPIAIGVVVLVGAAAIAFSPAREFASKIADVQESQGRLSSPIFPGEALGIWPAGDYRIVRGEVSGSLLAVALGAIAAGYGIWALIRARQFALLSMLVAGATVYAGTRVFAEIHVQAKALMVIAPLVLLVGLRALFALPSNKLRLGLGALVAVAAFGSSLIALRDTPVGFDERQLALEELAEQADGKPLVFLGVDRFAGYYLRDALTRAPAGYVPEEVQAREEKRWQQGLAADFDTLAGGQLDRFDYAITTAAAFASTPPPNFERIDALGDYLLWKRRGETPRSRILEPEANGGPGATLACSQLPDGRTGTAVVLDAPSTASYNEWKTPVPPRETAAGQELGWEAPGTATTQLSLPRAGQYELSLQYHSQVPLEVLYNGGVIATLPPSLEGMYLSGSGRGAYWPAGTIDAGGAAPTEIEVRASEPDGLAGTLGASRRVWLGDLAASSAAKPRGLALTQACGEYVDHYSLDRRGEG